MSRISLVIVVSLAGCAGCPGDALRVVNPVSWHELPVVELHEMCRDWDERTRGCVISREDGDHIYTVPVVK